MNNSIKIFAIKRDKYDKHIISIGDCMDPESESSVYYLRNFINKSSSIVEICYMVSEFNPKIAPQFYYFVGDCLRAPVDMEIREDEDRPIHIIVGNKVFKLAHICARKMNESTMIIMGDNGEDFNRYTIILRK